MLYLGQASLTISNKKGHQCHHRQPFWFFSFLLNSIVARIEAVFSNRAHNSSKLHHFDWMQRGAIYQSSFKKSLTELTNSRLCVISLSWLLVVR